MTDIWDGDYGPVPWGQRGRRLSTRREAVAEVVASLAADPRTAGRLTEVRREPAFDQAASTFYSAVWADSGMPAIVKLNVSPQELHWMRSLGEQTTNLVPRVLAGGEALGRHDVRWLVLERLPHRLSDAWGDRLYDLLAEATVRFQAAARALDQRFVYVECAHSTAEWLRHGQREGCPGPVGTVLARLTADWAWLISVCGLEVCFGDLTTGNALCREDPPGGERAILIDPIPRVAPWAWDGAYCQAIAAESDVQLIARMARLRRARGLHTPDDADLRRASALLLAWLGAMWWGIAPWRRAYPDWAAQIQRYIESAAEI
jgi:hypothetical protein